METTYIGCELQSARADASPRNCHCGSIHELPCRLFQHNCDPLAPSLGACGVLHASSLHGSY